MSSFYFNCILLYTLVVFAGCSSIPEKVNKQQVQTECTYYGGYSAYQNNEVYNNSCSKETEPLFLVGYRLSRKLTLMRSEIEIEKHHHDCLVLEKDLKFSRTLSPFRIEGSNDDVGKRLSEKNCSNSLFTSRTGLSDEIYKVKTTIESLNKKRNSIEDLHMKISATNPNATNLIEDYKKQFPQDEIDVDFRWKDYIEKVGGYTNLTATQRKLFQKELYKIPELKSEVINRSLIGFGLGHRYQNQDGGLKYTLIDSLVLAGIIYGIRNKDSSIVLPLCVFAIPLARGAQFYETYNYNIQTNIESNDLRTQLNQTTNQFQVKFSFSF